jgi:hypothetical protein
MQRRSWPFKFTLEGTFSPPLRETLPYCSGYVLKMLPAIYYGNLTRASVGLGVLLLLPHASARHMHVSMFIVKQSCSELFSGTVDPDAQTCQLTAYAGQGQHMGKLIDSHMSYSAAPNVRASERSLPRSAVPDRRSSLHRAAHTPRSCPCASCARLVCVAQALPSCELTVRLEGRNGAVMSISWHSRADILAVACYNKAVVLWDMVRVGALAHTHTQAHAHTHTRARAHTHTHTHTHTRTHTHTHTHTHNAQVLHTPIQTIVGFDHPCLSVAFQPGGRLLAIGSLRKPVQLWDVPHKHVRGTSRFQKPKALMQLEGHTDYVTWCAWDNTGRMLVTASRDHTAIVWDIQMRRMVSEAHPRASPPHARQVFINK